MYALPVMLFSALSKHLNVFGKRLLHCRLIVAITYDLHKLSDTQSILMYHSVVKVKKSWS